MASSAQQILFEALRKYTKGGKKLDISKFARDINLPYSTVYNPLFTNRQTNADVFLKILNGLGALEKQENGILINSKKARKIAS